MTPLQSVGKDNQTYNFRYATEDYFDSTCKVNKLLFFVYSADTEYEDFFDFKVTPIDNDTVKVTDMFLDSKYFFKGKGLPEALILEAQRLFPDKQIISSTNIDKFKRVCNEWRSIPGSSVWERLVKKGLARYDKEHDLYYLNRQ